MSPTTGEPPRSTVPELLVALRRWQDAGGVWRVVDRQDGAVTVALCRCDGGEEVDRMVSSHPRALAFLADRTSSLDDIA